ncbi:MAG: hypothetical protein LQ342_001218 [Letrouitia transgressa]|nr:MAG: hypothetical protein LQ342_001218 [Letrouitia transgressa]
MDSTAFWKSQLFITPRYPTKQYSNQTVIITGSNCGLGFEAARHFVRLNAAKVILAVRTTSKGDTARQQILKSEKKDPSVVEVWPLDLSSYASIKDFAKKAQALQRIDVLVQNAGIVTYNFTLTEGNESSITTNVISPFLLSLLLLPKLRETAVKFNTFPRLVLVESFVHHHTKFPERKADNIFDELAVKEKANMDDRYNVSKLLGILATRQLASLTRTSPKGHSVIINCMDPGWCYSEVMREWSGLKLVMFKISRAIFARSTEVGSRTILANAEAGEESHGQYYDSCSLGRLSRFVLSDEGAATQKKVWAQLAEILEKIEPGVLGNI